MTKQEINEYTRRITQANGTQMITIIYEITLTYLKDALSAYDKKDMPLYETNLTRAQNCINELMRSLDLNYDIAQNFMDIYIFAKREIVAAQIRKEKNNINNLISIFEKMQICYKELEKENDAPPIVSGAQSVYAGLTYGKGTLNETINDPYTNRGFMA